MLIKRKNNRFTAGQNKNNTIKVYSEEEIRNMEGPEPFYFERMLPDINVVENGQTVATFYEGTDKYIITAVKTEYEKGFTIDFQDISNEPLPESKH